MPDHWFIIYGPMPSNTLCRFRADVPLLKTSVHDGSASVHSALMFSSISLNWRMTRGSSSGLLSRRAMTCRPLSLWPCFTSHLGVSGTNRQVTMVNKLNSIWQATGKRHWNELLV